jgi:hypothetical protein
MKKAKFVHTILLVLMAVSESYSQPECGPKKEDEGWYRYRYQIFNPYSFLSYRSYSVTVKRDTFECGTGYEMAIKNPLGPPYNTIKMVFDTCDLKKSSYKYTQIQSAWPRNDIPYYSASLALMDTIRFEHEGSLYVLKKYRATLQDLQKITIYYSDSLGIVKQYASYRSATEDNFEMNWVGINCPQKAFLDAHLRALLERDDFHERYDPGPRTMRNRILDKREFKRTRRRYLKQRLILEDTRFLPNLLNFLFGKD